jgi:hypothetical protein
VTELTGLALQCEPNSRRLARLHRRAVHRGEAAGLRRRAAVLSEPMYRTGTATQAVAMSLRVLANAGPTALRSALEGSIAAARRVAQLPEFANDGPACRASEAAVRDP